MVGDLWEEAHCKKEIRMGPVHKNVCTAKELGPSAGSGKQSYFWVGQYMVNLCF